MALYEDLKRQDIVGPVVDWINNGLLIPTEDRKKFTPNPARWAPQPDISWIFTRTDPDRRCWLWARVYLSRYNIIPKECYSCWKIVATPKNILQLFDLHELQKEMDLNSKCGVEQRNFATFSGRYKGFWYAPLFKGMDEARELHRKVRNKVHSKLGVDVPVILKRACTEMENVAGPSNTWRRIPELEALQDKLDELFDAPEPWLFGYQPEAFKTRVKSIWIEKAFEWGDPKVKELVDRYPESFGVTKTVTYHDTIPEIEEGGAYEPARIHRLSDYK